jgi:hypothetical protein
MKNNTHRTAMSRTFARVPPVSNSQSRTWTLGVIASLAVALGSLVVPAHAESISGTFDGNSTLIPTGTPGVFTQAFTGDGDDTRFGAFTPMSLSTIDFSHPPNILFSNGTLVETFTDGTLFGTTSGNGTANGHGNVTFTIDYVINGGTGSLAGDTGEATLMGTITQTSATTESISDGSYTGSLTPVSELATLLVLVPGLLGMGYGLRRTYPGPVSE